MSEVNSAGLGLNFEIKGMDAINDALSKLQSIQQVIDRFNGGNGLNVVSTPSTQAINKINDAVKTSTDNIKKFSGNLSDAMNVNPSSLYSTFTTIDNKFRTPIDSINKLSSGIQNFKGDLDKSKFKVSEFGDEFTKQEPKVNGFRNKTLDAIKLISSNIKTGFGSGFKHAQDGASKLIDKLREVREKSSGFKNVFAGTMAANAVSSITSNTSSFVQSSANAAIGGQQTLAKWQNGSGLNLQQAQAMTAQISEIRGQSNMAGAAITDMQKRFLTLTGNADKAREMTNEMAAFGRASGASDEQIQGASQSLSRMFTMAKVRPAMLNKTLTEIPALKKGMAEAAGVSEQQFSKMVASGKMTGQQLQGYFEQASKGAGKAWSQYGQTFQGIMDSVKGTWTNMQGKFGSQMLGGIKTQLSDLAGSGKGLKEVQTQLSLIAANMGKNVGDAIGKAVKFLVDNRKALTDITGSLFSIIKLLVSGAWETFSGFLQNISGHSKDAKGGLDNVSDALKGIAAHKDAIKAIGGTLLTVFAVGKALKFAAGVVEVSKSLGLARVAMALFGTKTDEAGKMISLFSKEGLIARAGLKAWSGITKAFTAIQWAFNAAMDANPIGMIVLAITAVVAALVVLYAKFKPFRDLVNGVAKWFADAFGKMFEWVGKLGGKIGKFAGSVGKWFGGIWKSGTKAFDNLKKGTTKTFDQMHKDIGKTQSDSNKAQKAQLKVFYDIFHGKFGDLKKDIPKAFGAMFDVVKDIGKTAFNFLNNLTGGRLQKMADIFSDMFGKIKKIWSDAWNGIGNFFKGIWDWIKKIVANGINSVINVINGGIKGIDWVISKFGGNDEAIKPIDKVAFATGTGAFSNQRRAITKPTMAMLNDGFDSPETNNREMVIHPNGMSELVKGRNTTRLLAPGTEVLNATETKLIMQMQGLTKFANGTGVFNNSSSENNNVSNINSINKVIKHFANGTGIFNNLSSENNSISNINSKNESINRYASGTGFFGSLWKGVKSVASDAWNGAVGAVDSVKDKLKFVQKLIKNPMGMLSGMFKNPTDLNGDIMSQLGGGLFKSGVDTAKNWWSTLVNMISGSLDDGSGSASGLLAAVEKYGRGKKYAWGATGPDTFDCSGLVYYALKQAFGINYPRQSGAQIAAGQRVSASDAKPGDLIGNAGHIGVYAGGGKYWAAASDTASPNIGMWPVSAFPDGPHSFARVTGIKDQSEKTSKKTGGNVLQKLIKSQTGGMLGWISKHLAPLLGGGTDGNSPQGAMSKSSFAKIANQAANIMKISLSGGDIAQLYSQAFTESGVNPATGGGINDNDGTGLPYGLFQFKKGTWDAYAVSGHKNMYSALDQIMAVLNDSNWKRDVPPAGSKRGWSPSGTRRMATGGHITAGETAIVHEKGFELFKPSVDGKVIPNHEARNIMGGTKVTINSPITINGNASKETVDDIDKLLDRRNSEAYRKLDKRIGRDGDGMIVI